jgi:hypothetical protein
MSQARLYDRRTSSPRSRYTWAAGAVLVACAALSGCSDQRIDLRSLETAMRDRYGRDAAVPIESVTCPEWVRTRKDETFECQVRFQGGVVWTIGVVQGEQGNTQWLPRGQAVFADDIEPWLTRTLAEKGRQVQARCDARVYVIEPGQQITCKAIGADGRGFGVRLGHDDIVGIRAIDAAGAGATRDEARPPGGATAP